MSRQAKKNHKETESMILHAAARLFLEKGYIDTTMQELAKEAGVSYGELFRVGIDKENIISKLVTEVLEDQFEETHNLVKDLTNDKILFYATETVLQLYIAESSEHIRELYITSYSMFNSATAIYNKLTYKLQDIFKEYLPNHSTSDFYELEIASAGIMRNFLSVPCNMYFTMDRKVKRFLETTFLVYRVPDTKIKEAMDFVSQFNFKEIADKVIGRMLNYLETRI